MKEINYTETSNFDKGNYSLDGADFYLDRKNFLVESSERFSPQKESVPIKSSGVKTCEENLNDIMDKLIHLISELEITKLSLDVPNFFRVPEKYSAVTFEQIKEPSKTQKKLIKLLELALAGNENLTHNGNPQFSIYVNGFIGVGKTHICSAYLNCIRNSIKKDLDVQRHIIEMNRDNYASYTLTKLSREYNVIKEALLLQEKVLRKYTFNSDEKRMETIVKELSKLIEDKKFIEDIFRLDDFRTTPFLYDIAFLEFERIFNVYQKDKELIESLIKPKILLIDDLHPKGNKERAKLIQDLLEVRYNQEEGVTLVTSNLAPDELMKDGGYDVKILQRLLSRCKEKFIMFNINDTKDYREVLGEKKKKTINDLLSE